MRWAALYRRPPILRGVSASQIRADHAANQARINARYGPALPSSPQLRGGADAAHHSAVISQEARGPVLAIELAPQVHEGRVDVVADDPIEGPRERRITSTPGIDQPASAPVRAESP